MEACPFCNPIRGPIAQAALAVALRDAYPVSLGHTLVVTRRHVASYFECTEAERFDLWHLVDRVRDVLDAEYKPDGFNIGLNVGLAAGQTVLHCHVHVIPRYAGDVPDPRGGVRHAVFGKGYYPTGGR